MVGIPICICQNLEGKCDFPPSNPFPPSSYGPAQKEFSWHHRLHYCCCMQRVIWQMYLDNISSLEFIQQNRAPAHRMVVVRLNLLLSNAKGGCVRSRAGRGRGYCTSKNFRVRDFFLLVLRKGVLVYTNTIDS